jgi:hypothetical protein
VQDERQRLNGRSGYETSNDPAVDSRVIDLADKQWIPLVTRFTRFWGRGAQELRAHERKPSLAFYFLEARFNDVEP